MLCKAQTGMLLLQRLLFLETDFLRHFKNLTGC